MSGPGGVDMTTDDAVAVLSSGSGITTISVEIAHKLQTAFPAVQVVAGMSHPGKLKVSDGRVLTVGKNRCLVRIALNTVDSEAPGRVFLTMTGDS